MKSFSTFGHWNVDQSRWWLECLPLNKSAQTNEKNRRF
ncbi:hypothetical protein TcasGA2_TC034852 [Tribolium castaneum]|uniref:Uncharacterized protein n=1 Tax=Tribolium castaneum TaxID=7070 RepID=A0A139WCZ5_TRICA|nr:hypothetical protein TcasGA2_TC034852 [Tribolium castaneum]